MIKKSIMITKKMEPDRAVALLVNKASSFSSTINLTREEKTANAKSIMGMINFGFVTGASIDVSVDGEDEQEAMSQIEEFLTED